MKRIKKVIPDKIKVAIKGLFEGNSRSGWFGDYRSWIEAMKDCTGYDQISIVNKVRTSVLKVKNKEAAYERDSVVFDKLYLFEPLVKALKDSVNGEILHIVDFGGSLGSSYFQHKHLFEQLKDLKWSVVEQKHYVEIGKRDIAENHLQFYFTISQALKDQTNGVLMLSSVLQYLPEPYKLMEELLTYNFENIVIDRTAFIESENERITKQVVPEDIYEASYPAWFFNESKFKATFLAKYQLMDEFINDVPLPMEIEGHKVYWKGFYFKRRNG